MTLYFEDLTLGTETWLGPLTVDRDEVIDFARQFDPQPWHLDDAAARASIFGALCASGWQTCALFMRLLVRDYLGGVASLGSAGLDEVRWVKPVYPGETLRVRQVLTGLRASASRADRGYATFVWEMINQDDALKARLEGPLMIGRRPAGAPS